MRKYVLTLDLKDDPALIAEYKAVHQKIWPGIADSIKDAGIVSMDIYCHGNRLAMIMEVTDDFTFERKAKMDAENPRVQEWEAFVLKFQNPLPGSKESEKWQLMEQIFDLNKN